MIKLFTHTDLDGVGCAILANEAFKKQGVSITYCNYDDIDAKVSEFFDLNTDDEVHITDISISKELAEKINNSGRNYYLLDHHQTSLDLNEYYWCTVETETTIKSICDGEQKILTSGIELYYKFLIEENYISDEPQFTRFVSIVRNYDTWRWQSIGELGIISKNLNDLFNIYGRDTFMEKCKIQLENKKTRSSFPSLSPIDISILTVHNKQKEDYIESKSNNIRTAQVGKYKIGVVFADKHVSELGNRLCEKYKNFDAFAIVNLSINTVSYRTIRDDINLGKDIASLFLGGGHPKAAGNKIPEEQIEKFVEDIFDINIWSITKKQ